MQLETNPACRRLLNEVRWADTPLGPQAEWPVELRTLVNVMLGSLQPMLIVWGPNQITLYNDGYAAMCGERHPRAFGRPFRELWYDIWDQVEPIISAAYAGQGTSMDDIEFIMHRNGYPEETHFAFSYTPVADPWGTVLGMFCACTERTAEIAARKAEKSRKERLEQVFELNPGGIAMLVGPDHVYEYANEEYYTLIGSGRKILGKPVAEAVSEAVRQGFIDILDRVYRTGEPYIAKSLPVELNRGPEGENQNRLLDLVYQAMRGDDGMVSGILVQVLDVTERRAEETHRELLSHELGHRLKNQLAMVQAIVSQTLRNAPDLVSARAQLSERIAVLSKAHDLILSGGKGASTVTQLVNQMLALHDDANHPRISVAGPNLKVGSRPSLSLSLVLHELATNAAKHGALSVPAGKVILRWKVTGPKVDRFEMTWAESGGPEVAAPARTGSGMRLISAGLNGTADSKVDVTFDPDGLFCVVEADLVGFQQEH